MSGSGFRFFGVSGALGHLGAMPGSGHGPRQRLAVRTRVSFWLAGESPPTCKGSSFLGFSVFELGSFFARHQGDH